MIENRDEAQNIKEATTLIGKNKISKFMFNTYRSLILKLVITGLFGLGLYLGSVEP